MTKEDIIRMALDSKSCVKTDCNGVRLIADGLDIEHFAALVAAAEREACAKVCESGVDYEHPTVKGHIMENFGHSRLLANAIRARGQA